jgi:hypothetical protein
VTSTGATGTPETCEHLPVSEDQIRLVLPADPNYGRVARVAVQGLAGRLGLPARAVQDLRIAVDETLVLLLRPGTSAGQVTFTFTVTPDRLVIDAESTAGAAPVSIDAGARTRFEALVGDTVDRHEIDETGHHVHLEKSRTA